MLHYKYITTNIKNHNNQGAINPFILPPPISLKYQQVGLLQIIYDVDSLPDGLFYHCHRFQAESHPFL